jgi:type VI protein secretion system component VasK
MPEPPNTVEPREKPRGLLRFSWQLVAYLALACVLLAWFFQWLRLTDRQTQIAVALGLVIAVKCNHICSIVFRLWRNWYGRRIRKEQEQDAEAMRRFLKSKEVEEAIREATRDPR